MRNLRDTAVLAIVRNSASGGSHATHFFFFFICGWSKATERTSTSKSIYTQKIFEIFMHYLRPFA